MRENPASPGRHGSRLAVGFVSHASLVDENNAALPPPRLSKNDLAADGEGKPNTASPHAATGGEKNSADGHVVSAAALVHAQRAAFGFEPLIASRAAAQLLGNIHVKTLQRYARQQRIPGYQIGGHWYFRESELDAWLRHQINSNRQSVR